MFRSTPTAVSNSAPNTDDPKSGWVSGVLLIFPTAAAMLVLQSAAAVTTASASAAAIGFDYFSASDPVSSSVSDYPPSLLHSVDRVLEDLAKQHLDDLGLRVNMIDNAMQLKPFTFSANSAEMPSPRRVADPTGVYGQQDAAEGDVNVGGRKHAYSNNAMSVREETFTPFSVQALRPKNKTEGKIYSILMENFPKTSTKKAK